MILTTFYQSAELASQARTHAIEMGPKVALFDSRCHDNGSRSARRSYGVSISAASRGDGLTTSAVRDRLEGRHGRICLMRQRSSIAIQIVVIDLKSLVLPPRSPICELSLFRTYIRASSGHLGRPNPDISEERRNTSYVWSRSTTMRDRDNESEGDGLIGFSVMAVLRGKDRTGEARGSA